MLPAPFHIRNMHAFGHTHCIACIAFLWMDDYDYKIHQICIPFFAYSAACPNIEYETKKSQLQFIIFALKMNNGRPLILKHFKYLTALFRQPVGHLHLSSSSSVLRMV